MTAFRSWVAAGSRDLASVRDAGAGGCEPQAQASARYVGHDLRATT